MLAAQQQQQQHHAVAQQQQFSSTQQQAHPGPPAFGAGLQQLQQQAKHASSSGSELNHGSSSGHNSGFGAGLPMSFGSLPWQASPRTMLIYHALLIL
jgi:hypothetical protein